MDIRIEMTPEERKEFESLSEEKQQEFFEGVRLRRQILMLKVTVASMFLIECFDDLEELGIQKHKLKQLAKPYLSHLEKHIDKVFDVNDDDNASIEYLKLQTDLMHKTFMKDEKDKNMADS